MRCREESEASSMIHRGALSGRVTGSVPSVTSQERRLSFNSPELIQGGTQATPRVKTARISWKSLALARSHPFDRRCRMATALAKLEKLRARLRRFGRLRKVLKKLLAPGLEKALVFLDERLLGATSNAVERGNRRYRKMQKTVYRVRTQRAIEGRLALDLLREQHAQGRAQTTKILHKARAA